MAPKFGDAMCGIAGTLVFSGDGRVSSETLIAMRDAMAHRGPDGAGVWIRADERVGLAHRRLSIIDLSDRAAQPMSNRDETLHLVFNGEIYNHADIHRELERIRPRPWKTDHSDTEVLLQAFEEWGIDCLARLRGMFAFALWDERQRVLWLARDRVGIKPLYYSVHDGRVSFASEIKALLTDPRQKRAVDEESLFHYLSFITTPSPRTLFEGINKVPPGTWMRFDEHGTTREQRFWDVLDHARPLAHASEEEIAARLVEELREAVRLRKVSDVPVGVFLSGGIDSSTNAALFAQGSSERIRTFSIGYDADYRSYQNELHFARLMADKVGAQHHELKLRLDDLLDFLPRMIHLQDEPIGDPVCVPVHYVSKLARDNGVTVCQVGEGADELFWGYPTWKTKLYLERANTLPVPRALKRMLLWGLARAGKGNGLPYEALRRAVEGQPIFWGGVDAFTDAEKKRMLSPRLRERFANFTSWHALQPIHERFMQSAWEKTPLNWMSYVDLNLRLPELLLMRVDKMSMGVSLEARVPFLDHKFVELAMSIPERVKTRHGTLKYILKKAVRGIIPDELIDRKKQGFGVPVMEWSLDRLGAYVREELTDFCRRTDYFDKRQVQALLERGVGAGGQLWYLLNFALWHRHYIEQDGIALHGPSVATAAR